MTREREYAVDFLKFFAALLITNSHLESFEPQYPLATGGSIGDVLFLFCSGYTLFMGRMARFDNWYKRRLGRIFPPVLCWAILAAFFFGARTTMDDVVINGGGWFVQCILIYYILAYPIRRLLADKIWAVFVLVSAIVYIWFFTMPKGADFMFYGWNYCKWAAFFLFFLQGAAIGLQRKKKSERASFSLSMTGLALSVISWYAILLLQKSLGLNIGFQLLSLVPLLGISYFFFGLCRSALMEKVFYNRYANPVIRAIGGLCFEIYLVQITLLQLDVISISYPWNIAAMWCVIFFWAYVLHVFANFCTQTIKDMEYDWKRVFSPY